QGEAEHQKVKRYYKRASKYAFTRGIAKQNQRERTLRKIRDRKKARDLIDSAKEPQALGATDCSSKQSSIPNLHFKNQEELPYTSPEVHYHMSSETKHKIQLATWLPEHKDDPAFQNFLPRLQDHLLMRLLGLEYNGDEKEFTTAERNHVVIVKGSIYQHRVLRINYTTYDMR
ncbi:hypothetical protein F5887DRAFT_861233, partial [Amanita rubescens]